MAEHAWGMALSLARDGHRSWRERGDWDGWRQQLSQRAVPIYGSTCLLLGYGGIGRHLAAIGHAFGAKCVALRQQATTAAASETEVRMVTQAQLPEVLPEVRLVLNSLPGGAQTRHLIDARFLAALPAPAIIVNVGRGSTIDQAALLTAIRSGRVRAGLDVFAHEPLVPSSPLWEEAEVVLTPHAAAITSDYLVRGAAQQRQQMQRFVTGQPLLWQAADEGAPIRL
jgi:phosphoglycerate dehydrogenase-like enzyme